MGRNVASALRPGVSGSTFSAAGSGIHLIVRVRIESHSQPRISSEPGCRRKLSQRRQGLRDQIGQVATNWTDEIASFQPAGIVATAGFPQYLMEGPVKLDPCQIVTPQPSGIPWLRKLEMALSHPAGIVTRFCPQALVSEAPVKLEFW